MNKRTEGKGPRRRKRRGHLDDERPLDVPSAVRSREVRVLYVACEGDTTEPDYLAHLNRRFGDGDGGARKPFRIQPVSRRNGMTPAATVAAARDAAEEDEAWALFDRDQHHDILQAIKAAADSRVDVCFSHPSFELWLLLHFQPFSGAQSGSSKIVMEKLRKANTTFRDYDKSIKGKRSQALEKKEGTAVRHARALVKSCAHGSCGPGQAKTERIELDGGPEPATQWAARSGHASNCPVLSRDPSTDVWRLLVSLGIDSDGC